jgi:hypothetical protein
MLARKSRPLYTWMNCFELDEATSQERAAPISLNFVQGHMFDRVGIAEQSERERA